MSTITETVTIEQVSYKYRWARSVARNKLDEDFQVLSEKLTAPGQPPPETYAQLLQKTSGKLTGREPPKPGEFKVGIVGAGCAGLFTAMILDHLREKIDGINISYDILEASGEDRLGGRLYTHHFSEKPNDYYDVGAMRFPDNKIMKRTFRLFKLLGMSVDNKKLLPYYFKDDNNVCPSYYNNIPKVGTSKGTGPLAPTGVDPYELNKGLPLDDQIPLDLISKDPNEVMDYVLDDYKKQIKKHFGGKKHSKNGKGQGSGTDKGWIPLEDADFMSTRQFLRSKENPRTGFNFNTIEWLETFDTGTGLYDQALTETVLESLDFDMKAHWFCVKGGTQEVAKEMANRLQQKPEFNRQVTAIKAEKDGTMHLTIKHGEESQLETRDYFAVFNSTTLGALQRMDLTEAGLRYGTKQAIRSLGYGASCKVGIKFKSPWWEHAPYNINKGGMGKTDLPLRVCVYPSYNINTPKNESAVLLCSYTWSQDAQRIGSLISRSSPSSEDELKELLLQNLALLHSPEGTREQYEKTLKKITKEYEIHYAYDWYSDPHTAGAFAYFGPGQFSKMWPEIIRPNGWLYLIGEAASAHHAWIVGALESAVRAAFQMLKTLNIQYMKNHGGKAYGPYVEAMELLDTDDGSPFGPLPEEMPDRQKDVPPGTETVDVPTRGKVLNFSAAEIYLSFCELAAERAEEESKQAA